MAADRKRARDQRPADVDLEAGCVNVTGTLKRVQALDGKGTLLIRDETKTVASLRTLPLPRRWSLR